MALAEDHTDEELREQAAEARRQERAAKAAIFQANARRRRKKAILFAGAGTALLAITILAMISITLA